MGRQQIDKKPTPPSSDEMSTVYISRICVPRFPDSDELGLGAEVLLGTAEERGLLPKLGAH